MFRKCVFALGALLISQNFSALAAGGELGSFAGACDGSAAAALDAKHFVVADDDSNVLRIFNLETRAGVPRPFESFLDTSLDKDTGAPKESDIEGAARIGDRIYWIASHGRKSGGKADDNRKRLFAARVTSGAQPDVEAVGAPYRDLRKHLLADPRYRDLDLAAAYGGEDAKEGPRPEGENGFNIEGLAATEDGHLLIGFRNPQPKGKALIAPLRNPAQLVDGKDTKPDFGDPILLDLEDRGIRSMERVGKRYLIVAGPFGNAKDSSAFQLREWSGRPNDSATKPLLDIAPPANAKIQDASPEALFALTGETEIVILFDEGDREIGGQPKASEKGKDERNCKSLAPNERSFRGVKLTVPH